MRDTRNALNRAFGGENRLRHDNKNLIGTQKDFHHLRVAEQEPWIKYGILKIRDVFYEPRDDGAIPVQMCFYLSVDLDVSSSDVVDELRVRLEELVR